MPRKPTGNIVHQPEPPKLLTLLQCVQVARIHGIPLKFIMGEDMYDNWRRRCARLRRARITAQRAGDTARMSAVNAALKRLSTGVIS